MWRQRRLWHFINWGINKERGRVMSEAKRIYIAIDLKSFYASVECVERGLDPLTTNLVVADASRTEKTICLAVSPSLKKYGIPGRARLFEVVQKCEEIKRRTGKEVPYIVATPRMQLYIDYSSRIYRTYLKYVSPEDIHVYSIDEIFADLTDYLALYRKNEETDEQVAKRLAGEMVKAVYDATKITATVGVGTNLYLAKVAMDIVAKHTAPDKNNVRMAFLDEMEYRKTLWDHKPITDFWRIGRGLSRKLAENGMYTMGDIARLSLQESGYGSGEDMLFHLFGVDAELLIDHAWGLETCTMKDIKAYKPSANSISSGQVLHCGYPYDKARIIVREMVELAVLDLVSKKRMTNAVTLDVGYDREFDESRYDGDIATDPYGRAVSKPAHGSKRMKHYTSSTRELVEATLSIFEKAVNPALKVRRVTISFGNVLSEEEAGGASYEQLDFFSYGEKSEEEVQREAREKRLQSAMLAVQGRYGKNAMLKGTNLEEGATTMERNRQIGGHKA